MHATIGPACTARASRSRAAVRLAAALVLLLATGPAAADDPAAACHALADRDARLACYDRVTARPAAAAPAPTAETAAPVAETPAEPAAPVAQIPAVPAAPVAETPAAPAAPASAATGPAVAAPTLSNRGRREPTSDEAITGALIVELLTTSIGRQQFLLDNGELWEQVEVRRVTLRQGDRVDVRPSVFGTWQMRASNGKSRSLNVRRAN